MFGVDVAVDVPVQRLSIAQRQLAQIARALAVPHRIAIFDEPTASLTPVETEALLKLIRELKAKGVAVLYISHRLEEVKAIADVVTVLRDGKLVATRPAAELQPVDMARLMVGRDLLALYPPRPPEPAGAPAFAVSGFGAQGFRRGRQLFGAAGRDSRLFRARRRGPHGVVRGVVRTAQRRRRNSSQRRMSSTGPTRAARCAPAPSI